MAGDKNGKNVETREVNKTDWQQETSDTLGRIEGQGDSDKDKQEGFALDFRERVVGTLARIEEKMDGHEKDNKKDFGEVKNFITEIKPVLKEIPIIKISLTNHLTHHDKFQRYLMYPVLVAITIAFGVILWKVILHISKVAGAGG
jgi:hypothetical protein